MNVRLALGPAGIPRRGRHPVRCHPREWLGELLHLGVTVAMLYACVLLQSKALLVTTDTHVAPKRERDRRNGFSLSLDKTPRNIMHVLSRPRWIRDVLVGAGLAILHSERRRHQAAHQAITDATPND